MNPVGQASNASPIRTPIDQASNSRPSSAQPQVEPALSADTRQKPTRGDRPKRNAKLTSLSAYRPAFRSEFTDRADYLGYVRELGPRLSLLGHDPATQQTAPVLEKDFAPSPRVVGPHPETLMDPDGPIDVLGYRIAGKPLAMRSEKLGTPLIGLGASGCCFAWLTATNESGTDGAHVLCHISPTNDDPFGPIKDETARLKRDGFTVLKAAFITGGSTNPLDYLVPQPAGSLRRTASVAGQLVESADALGYAVIDHTRDHRPHFSTKQDNVGGLMFLNKAGKVEFMPIGRGLYAPPGMPLPPEVRQPASSTG